MDSYINAIAEGTSLHENMTHKALKSIHGCGLGAINGDSECF